MSDKKRDFEKDENKGVAKDAKFVSFIKKHYILLALVAVVVYIGVSVSFASIIPCDAKDSKAQCECFRDVITQKVPFYGKVKILLFGGRPASYMSVADLLPCAFQD